MIFRLFLLGLLLPFTVQLSGQNPLRAASDTSYLLSLSQELFLMDSVELHNAMQSTDVLIFEDYLVEVLSTHPLAKAAAIQPELASAYIQKARGEFDPKLMGGYDRKLFKEVEYYELWDAKIKIPTQAGLSILGAYELNEGEFLNAERSVPETGLWKFGLEAQLAEGLWLDKRRAGLKQAKIYYEASLMEQQSMLNELLLLAAEAYWNWFNAFYAEWLNRQVMELSRQRLQDVKSLAELGNIPMVDTLEASLQLDQRSLDWLQSRLEKQQSELELALYLWTEDGAALAIRPDVRPISPNAELPDARAYQDEDFNALLARNPTLRKFDFEIAGLEVEQTLRRQALLPQLNVQYWWINDLQQFGPVEQSFDQYVLGVQFEMPLFLRKERAELRLNQFMLQGTQLNQQFKFTQYLNAANNFLQQGIWYSDQTSIYRNMVVKRKLLLDAENELFLLGSSSLFLLNQRESKWRASQTKLLKLLSTQAKTTAKLEFYLNQFPVARTIP